MKKRTRKPRPIEALGDYWHVKDSGNIPETIKDTRRLAAWLISAAEWLEGKKR